MLVLGIESTCDETACSIVKDGRQILSNVVASQHDLHEKYGGVFPEVAARRHSEVIIQIVDEAIQEANISLDQVDLIAVARGPGLVGAILVGMSCAKSLAFSLNKPLIGVNHVDAHLYASLMSQETPPTFPSLGVVLSGGHTHLLLMHGIGKYELIGQTRDDAVGEAFDKVARVLDLPYPGGPKIEALASEGDHLKYPFKVGQIKNSPFDFSFSGIKTGVLYTVKGQNGSTQEHSPLSDSDIKDVAASFQHTVFTDIIKKTLNAANLHGCQTIILGGGVTNNQQLRKMFSKAAPKHTFLWPSTGLSLDNAAMIAGLGYHQYKSQEEGDSLHLEAFPRIPLQSTQWSSPELD